MRDTHTVMVDELRIVHCKCTLLDTVSANKTMHHNYHKKSKALKCADDYSRMLNHWGHWSSYLTDSVISGLLIESLVMSFIHTI